MSVVLIQKLIVAGIVDITSIIHFLFSKSNTDRLLHSYMFEILNNTLSIITSRTKKLKAELASAERAREKVMDLVDGPDKAIGIEKVLNRIANLSLNLSLNLILSLICDEKAKTAKDAFDKAQKVKKEVFLGVFQRFAMTLTRHLTESEEQWLAEWHDAQPEPALPPLASRPLRATGPEQSSARTPSRRPRGSAFQTVHPLCDPAHRTQPAIALPQHLLPPMHSPRRGNWSAGLPVTRTTMHPAAVSAPS